MQLDLPRIIEHAADDVAHASRAAAESFGGFVHDLDVRAIRPAARRRSSRNRSILVVVGVVGALLVVRVVISRRRQRSMAGRPAEATTTSSPMPEAARSGDQSGDQSGDEVYAAERFA